MQICIKYDLDHTGRMQLGADSTRLHAQVTMMDSATNTAWQAACTTTVGGDDVGGNAGLGRRKRLLALTNVRSKWLLAKHVASIRLTMAELLDTQQKNWEALKP